MTFKIQLIADAVPAVTCVHRTVSNPGRGGGEEQRAQICERHRVFFFSKSTKIVQLGGGKGVPFAPPPSVWIRL